MGLVGQQTGIILQSITGLAGHEQTSLGGDINYGPSRTTDMSFGGKINYGPIRTIDRHHLA